MGLSRVHGFPCLIPRPMRCAMPVLQVVLSRAGPLDYTLTLFRVKEPIAQGLSRFAAQAQRASMRGTAESFDAPGVLSFHVAQDIHIPVGEAHAEEGLSR